MKKNNYYLSDNEMNLTDLIRVIWKQKILILFITTIFVFSVNIYNKLINLVPNNEDIKYTTIITINSHQNFFKKYKPYSFLSLDETKILFTNIFTFNVTNLTNFQIFFEKAQSKEYDEFKTYLQKKNISIQNYFKTNSGNVIEKNIKIGNKFFLTYTKPLIGSNFVNDYLEFIKNRTNEEYKNILKISIQNNLNVHKKSFLYAKLIGLDKPMLFNNVRDDDFFYLGTAILTQKISDLENLLLELEKDQFHYDLYLSSETVSVKRFSINLHPLVSFILGFFLSLAIIFFREILKHK